jgi:PP-loop superfamily ATP-utilizing enzyme
MLLILSFYIIFKSYSGGVGSSSTAVPASEQLGAAVVDVVVDVLLVEDVVEVVVGDVQEPSCVMFPAPPV